MDLFISLMVCSPGIDWGQCLLKMFVPWLGFFISSSFPVMCQKQLVRCSGCLLCVHRDGLRYCKFPWWGQSCGMITTNATRTPCIDEANINSNSSIPLMAGNCSCSASNYSQTCLLSYWVGTTAGTPPQKWQGVLIHQQLLCGCSKKSLKALPLPSGVCVIPYSLPAYSSCCFLECSLFPFI